MKYAKFIFITLLMLSFLAGCNKNLKAVIFEIPYDNYNDPVIIGDQMYLSVNRFPNDQYSISSLISYHLKLNEVDVIYDSEFVNPQVQDTSVNNHWLIWVDSNEDGQYQKILAMDRKSQEVTTLAETTPERYSILAPYLYEDYVAWIQMDENSKFVVKLYNLKNKELTNVATLNNTSLMNAFVYIGDNKLLWTDYRDGKGYYHLYDILSGKTEQWEAPREIPGYAKYSKGKIFAIHFTNDGNWTNQDFGYFDTKTGNYKSIVSNGKYINYFDTSKDHLAVLDSENKLTYYQIKNDELTVIELEEFQEESLQFLSFDSEGNLILTIESEVGDYKSKIGVVYPN